MAARTNTELLSEMRTDIALIKASQLELTKIIKGNGKMGLAEKVDCQDHELERMDNTLKIILEESAKEKLKKEKTKDKWFWLIIERFAVPIAMAVITAYVLAPLLK